MAKRVAFVFPDDVPEKYRKYKPFYHEDGTPSMGVSSIVLEFDKKHLIMITQDSLKVKFLTAKKPNGVQLGKLLEKIPFVTKGMDDNKHFNKELFILKVKRLRPLPEEKHQLIDDLVTRMEQIEAHIRKSGEVLENDEVEIAILSTMSQSPEFKTVSESLTIMANFLIENGAGIGLVRDYHYNNWMQDADGNIMIVDPWKPRYIEEMMEKGALPVDFKTASARRVHIVNNKMASANLPKLPKVGDAMSKQEYTNFFGRTSAFFLVGKISQKQFDDCADHLKAVWDSQWPTSKRRDKTKK